MRKPKTTLRTIAAELDIAPSTVLRALSGKPNVNPALRKKIVSCAAAHQYVLPNYRTGNVAVLTPGNSIFNYLSILINALSDELHKEGFRVFILSEEDADALNDYLYDGVISTTWVSGIEKKFAKIHSLPFVSLNGANNQQDNIFTVSSDDHSGITTGLKYLHDAGCRKIIFAASAPEGNRGSHERVSAFNQFCLRHNLSAEELFFCTGKNTFSALAAKLISLKADAIFYATEGNALQLYSELQKQGLKIPGDISVLGLEYPPVSGFLDPPLTALRQDFEGLARESVAMLKKLIAGEQVNADIRLPYTLIERESVRKIQK